MPQDNIIIVQTGNNDVRIQQFCDNVEWIKHKVKNSLIDLLI